MTPTSAYVLARSAQRGPGLEGTERGGRWRLVGVECRDGVGGGDRWGVGGRRPGALSRLTCRGGHQGESSGERGRDGVRA